MRDCGRHVYGHRFRLQGPSTSFSDGSGPIRATPWLLVRANPWLLVRATPWLRLTVWSIVGDCRRKEVCHPQTPARGLPHVDDYYLMANCNFINQVRDPTNKPRVVETKLRSPLRDSCNERFEWRGSQHRNEQTKGLCEGYSMHTVVNTRDVHHVFSAVLDEGNVCHLLYPYLTSPTEVTEDTFKLVHICKVLSTGVCFLGRSIGAVLPVAAICWL